MAYFSKFKIGSTSYDVKDAAAGKSLSVSGTSLSLKNAAGTAISTVTLPGGGSNDPIVIQISYETSDSSIYPQNFNNTPLPYITFTYNAIDAAGNVYPQTIDTVMQKVLEGFPTIFAITPDSSVIATVSKSDLVFTLKSIGNVAGSDSVILTFESDIDNGYVYQIILTVDKYIYTISSCYGEKIALGGGSSSSIKEIEISQIGTGDANMSALWNIGSSQAQVLNGPNDYKTLWTDSSVTYVLKLQQDGTLIYLNQRYKYSSSIYVAYATIYNYDYNDPHYREVQFICAGSPLQYFTVKKCTAQ